MSPLSDFQDFQIKVSRWHLRMDGAEGIGEVLAILRDYVDTLTPAELAALPPKCRPGRLKGEDDIAHWTFILAQHQCREDGVFEKQVHQEVLNHFLHAQLRVAEILKGEAIRQ
jgi:hypothetical protein